MATGNNSQVNRTPNLWLVWIFTQRGLWNSWELFGRKRWKRREHLCSQGSDLPFVKALIFEEGVSMFSMWVCLFKEDMELQKAKCFVTQKCNSKWNYTSDDKVKINQFVNRSLACGAQLAGSASVLQEGQMLNPVGGLRDRTSCLTRDR